MNRKTKDFLKQYLWYAHRIGLRLGFHILPKHYHINVPDVVYLDRNRHVWAKRSDLPGIHVDADAQLEAMIRLCTPFQSEYAGNRVHLENLQEHSGPGYGYLESQCLHAMIRALKPAHIVEIGSGDSTQCMLVASRMNQKEGGRASRITCVEPYPSEKLRTSKEINLIPKFAQEVPLDVFTALQPGDFMFIDSSHVVQTGSDVNYLYLEVIPRLGPGVTIHIHDIFLPYDYPRNMMKSVMYWNENTLLRGLLTHNSKLEILFCMSQLFYDRPEGVKKVFPEFVPQPGENGLYPDTVRPFEPPPGHFPSSIYLQTV